MSNIEKQNLYQKEKYDKQNTYEARQKDIQEMKKEFEATYEVKPQAVEEAKPVESNTVQVRALDAYQKNLITDKELGRIPQKGEIFTVSKERFEILSGKNEHKIVFVEKI